MAVVVVDQSKKPAPPAKTTKTSTTDKANQGKWNAIAKSYSLIDTQHIAVPATTAPTVASAATSTDTSASPAPVTTTDDDAQQQQKKSKNKRLR